MEDAKIDGLEYNVNLLLSASKASPATRDSVYASAKPAKETGTRQNLENVLNELFFTFRKVIVLAPRMLVPIPIMPTVFRKKLSCSGIAELIDPTVLPTAAWLCVDVEAKISLNTWLK